ncbi:MAG: hypothetical protein HKN25_07740 [Pyrinomonadaceae bacterium]|nr:hypothetical protein [Pyrinomonadaceae bacterium]
MKRIDLTGIMRIYAHKQVLAVRKLQYKVVSETGPRTKIIEQLERLAENLVSAFHNQNLAVAMIITNWHPTHIGKNPEEIMRSEFTAADAKLTIAREHGFSDWKDAANRATETFNMDFENSVDTLLSGDVGALKAQVEENPGLLKERSKYGHKATLLHYAGSNGVETRRQIVPSNLPECVKLLIKNGADKNATANLYGGEFTTLELASTSAHPKDAGILNKLLSELEN